MSKTKKLFATIISLCVIMCLSLSCDKTTDDNYLQIGNNKYLLTEGYYIDYDTLNVNYYPLGLALYGMTTMTSPINISFMMYSKTKSDFSEGEYLYSKRNKQFSFDQAGWSTISGTINVYSGSVNIKREGADYVIDINCTDEDNNVITGHFKGKLIDKSDD